jgi:hypothetical protein
MKMNLKNKPRLHYCVIEAAIESGAWGFIRGNLEKTRDELGKVLSHE